MYYIYIIFTGIFSLLFLLLNPLHGVGGFEELSRVLVIGHWITLLFHIPIYITGLFRVKKNSGIGYFIMLGATGAFLYNNLWIVITQPLSIFFPVYALMALISIIVIVKLIKGINLEKTEHIGNRYKGIFLILTSIIFYILWLAQIGLAILSDTPLRHSVEWGTPTSAVHILDMVFFLPLIFYIGLNNIKKRSRSGGYYITSLLMVIILGSGMIISRVEKLFHGDFSGIGSALFLLVILIIGTILGVKRDKNLSK